MVLGKLACPGVSPVGVAVCEKTTAESIYTVAGELTARV